MRSSTLPLIAGRPENFRLQKGNTFLETAEAYYGENGTIEVGTVKAVWLDMDGTVKSRTAGEPEPCLDAYSGGNLQLFGISTDAFR